MDLVEWMAIVIGLVSGMTTGGISVGVMRGQIAALRHDLDVLRRQQETEARECRARIDAILSAARNQ